MTVDLPHPDGPIRAIISLGRTAKEMSSRTRRIWPFGCGKSWQTCRNSQSGTAAAGRWSCSHPQAQSRPMASFRQRISRLGQTDTAIRQTVRLIDTTMAASTSVLAARSGKSFASDAWAIIAPSPFAASTVLSFS